VSVRSRATAATRRLWRDEAGASAVEFALVVSILIALCMGTLQLGWALQVRNELAKAADAAIRYAALHPESSDEEFEDEARSALAEYGDERLTVEAGAMTVNETGFRTLTVGYAMGVFIPGFPRNVLSLSVSRRTPDLSDF
jgi:Flp pilus assembly protein TadG